MDRLMHSIIHVDGSHRQSHFLRWALASAYGLFGLGGTLLLLSPELGNIYQQSGVWMAGFIAFGGAASALGNALQRWPGEFIGAPLVAFGLCILGFESWLTSHVAYPLLANANLAILCGLGLLIAVRWRRVVAVFRFTHRVALIEKERRRSGRVG